MNCRNTRRAILAALALFTIVPVALAFDTKHHGTAAQCLAGNCDNGEGTIRHQDGTEYTGLWTQGRFTNGKTYKVRSPIQPGRFTEVQFSGEGTVLQGTLLRGDPANGKGPVGEFTGTFAQVWNPFINHMITSYHVGRYTDLKLSRIYEGEFSYIPARMGGVTAGFLIFQGARIDNENDEVVRGLFVSEQLLSGQPVVIRKARPDYLVKLQQDFEAAQVTAVADARRAVQTAEDERKSSENMSSLMGVMGGLLAIGGGGGGGGLGGKLGLLQSNSLAGLTGAMTGKSSSGDILQGVLSQVMQQAGSDPSLSKALGGASSAAGLITSLTSLGQSSQPVTRAQYAAQVVSRLTSPATPGSANATSTGSAVVDALGASMINRTTNAITSAITGNNDTLGLGNLGGALLKQALSPPAVANQPAAIARQPAGKVTDTPGTVQLQYTPGKGFLDPVTGKFIKTMEEMSCDNVTNLGQKLRDLPANQRTCVETGNKSSAGKPNRPVELQASSTRIGNGAQLAKIDPPEGLHFRGDRLFATNDGVYAAMSGADGSTVSTKRTLGRGSVGGWLTSRLPKGSAKFSVQSLVPESPDEFSIMWATDRDRYGYINMNNGGVNLDFRNDGGEPSFVPAGAKTKSSFHWAVNDDSQIFLESFGGGGATTLRGRYKQIDTGAASVFKDLAATDEEGTTLFVADGSRKGLVQVTASAGIRKIDLSSIGEGTVNTLIAAHNRLWIGYGSKIVTLADGKITPVATMQGVFATTRPTFCMAGTTLYMADGKVMEGVNIMPSSPRSFLQNSPNIRPEDMKIVTEIKTALNMGMYCTDAGAYGPVIYAMGADLGSIEQKLFVIRPK